MQPHPHSRAGLPVPPRWLIALALVLLAWALPAGYWEPGEIEAARAVAEPETTGAAAAADPRDAPPPTSLTVHLARAGTSLFGDSEIAARLPLFLLSLVALYATFLLANMLAGRRAATYATVALLTSPLFLAQANHLTASIGATTGTALLCLGVVGLLAPRESAPPLLTNAAASAVGALLLFTASGALVGLLPVTAGMFLASWAAASADDPPNGRRRRVAIASGVATLLALLLLFAVGFDLREGYPGERALFGYRLSAAAPSVTLGGRWLAGADPDTTFAALFDHIAFGFFPWSAVAPLAMLALLGPESRAPLRSRFLFAWALLAWAAATVATHHIAPVQYPALPVLAVAVGLWFDRLHSQAAEPAGPSGRLGDSDRSGVPLIAALFVAFAAVVVAKDMTAFPATVAELGGAEIKYPKEFFAHAVFSPLGILAGTALLWACLGRGPAGEIGHRLRLRRAFARVREHAPTCVPLAAAVAVAGAVAVQFVWSPALTRRLSPKAMLSAKKQLDDNAPLRLLNSSPGVRFYAGEETTELTQQSELVDFFTAESPAFAIVRKKQLCSLYRAATDIDTPFFVLHDDNEQHMLVANVDSEGADRNPLSTTLTKSPPEEMDRAISASFDDRIELIGVDMPQRVAAGRGFEVTLYYRVIADVHRDWKVFVHFDGPGRRFNGDHEPIEGACGTASWRAGDYIVDRFEVSGGASSVPPGRYQVRTGFYYGKSGNFTNMKVTGGKGDHDNRIDIGSVDVD